MMPIAQKPWAIILALIVNFMGLPAWAMNAEKPTLTIAADLWCPINCDVGQAHQGVGVDLAKAIFEPLGYKVVYIILPWARALEDVRSGQIDAVIGANNEDDPSLVFPHAPITSVADAFYVLKDNPLTFDGLDSLRSQRLGVIRDYGYNFPIQSFISQQMGKHGLVQQVAGDTALDQNIKKLLAGRIDVVVESRPIMEYKLTQSGLKDKIRYLGHVTQSDIFLAFSPALPQSRKRAQYFDRGMERLKQSQSFNKIYAFYGVQP